MKSIIVKLLCIIFGHEYKRQKINQHAERFVCMKCKDKVLIEK